MGLNIDLLEKYDVFILILVRMTGLFVIAPVFGRRNIPAIMKVGFSFFLSIILINTNLVEVTIENSDILSYMLIVIKEFVVGAGLGFIVYMIFSAIYVAGQLIDMQIGFGMVNVLDPVSNIQVPITANFYYIFSMLVFLMVRGHYVVIRALYDSYQYVPLNGTVFKPEMPFSLVRVFGGVFYTGFLIAAPVTATILIVNVALGVMSKAVPQLNVFVLGMPMKIMIGLIVILASISMFTDVLNDLFGQAANEMFKYLRYIGP